MLTHVRQQYVRLTGTVDFNATTKIQFGQIVNFSNEENAKTEIPNSDVA